MAPLVRRIRPWKKKRGNRRTGSHLLGSIGEGSFFAILLLVGFVAVTALVTSQLVVIPGAPQYATGRGLWLAVLILATFILIGAGGLVYTFLQLSTSAERRSALARRATQFDLNSDRIPAWKNYPTIPRHENLFESPGIELAYRLPLVVSPAWGILGTLLYALLWNGLLATIAVMAIEGFWGGQPRWAVTLLTIPLTVMAVRTTHLFLVRLVETTSIGPTSLEVSDLPLLPGQRYEICLVQLGRGRVKSLSVRLVCEEEATFRQGTNVRRERRRIFDRRLFRLRDIEIRPDEPFSHQADLLVPTRAMHSFQSTSNAIQWRLLVVGRLKRGVRIERSFPVVVYPSPIAQDQG